MDLQPPEYETRVAIVEGGALQELHVERALVRGLVSNVYLGKVVRVLPGMQSAFIDIGLERAAFLHVADVWHPPAEGETVSAARAASAICASVAPCAPYAMFSATVPSVKKVSCDT